MISRRAASGKHVPALCSAQSTTSLQLRLSLHPSPLHLPISFSEMRSYGSILLVWANLMKPFARVVNQPHTPFPARMTPLPLLPLQAIHLVIRSLSKSYASAQSRFSTNA